MGRDADQRRLPVWLGLSIARLAGGLAAPKIMRSFHERGLSPPNDFVPPHADQASDKHQGSDDRERACASPPK